MSQIRLLDFLGQEIAEGCYVIYTTSTGSSNTEARLGRVVKIKGGQVLCHWIKSNKYRLPESRTTEVNYRKLHVMPSVLRSIADLEEIPD